LGWAKKEDQKKNGEKKEEKTRAGPGKEKEE
jgi:hypothetical protein